MEVELKFSLEKREFETIENKIKEICEFVKKVKQKDKYFNHPKRDFTNPDTPNEWLSIRKRGKNSKLNYKHFYEKNGEFTHCDEIDFSIENEKKAKKLFKVLDFKHLVTVEKTRKIYKYKNKFEIALDFVENLGYFIEIESLKSFGSVENARKKLFEFSKKLGVNSKPDNKGYPHLLMEKKGLL